MEYKDRNEFMTRYVAVLPTNAHVYNDGRNHGNQSCCENSNLSFPLSQKGDVCTLPSSSTAWNLIVGLVGNGGVSDTVVEVANTLKKCQKEDNKSF
ncbi:hypothetical protein NC653_037161 [Populus alba x Populus x berolinensis]|uniref:Uncharacterized protein n=1 Tax=Populus alba x Populus x berolinensis TaxID=444605 RepID=A0AAD6LFA8_9ROSI|nr:hypothetical protein NC653_037161 [Populus alba x Populus x berolinensis]